MGVITIARQAESGGEAVADRLAKDLGITLVDRPLLERLTQEHGLTGQDLDEKDEARPAARASGAEQVHVEYIQAVLLDLAAKEDLIIVGRGGSFLFRECPWSLHVKVIAGLTARRKALQQAQPIADADAELWLSEVDRQRSQWIRQHYGADWEDPSHYDLILRSDRLGIDAAATVIRTAAETRGILGRLTEIARWLDDREKETLPEPLEGSTRFVHPSEAEFARVLDFYRIRWQYEPRSFPLAWDAAGRPTEAFTPDFYLSDLDLYIELTTLKQSLVTDKNRKVRRFRELYPDIQLKVFYGRDFRSLVQKYGLSPAGLARTPEHPSKGASS